MHVLIAGKGVTVYSDNKAVEQSMCLVGHNATCTFTRKGSRAKLGFSTVNDGDCGMFVDIVSCFRPECSNLHTSITAQKRCQMGGSGIRASSSNDHGGSTSGAYVELRYFQLYIGRFFEYHGHNGYVSITAALKHPATRSNS